MKSVKEIFDYSKYGKISIALMLIFLFLFILPRFLIQWISLDLINFRIIPLIWVVFLLFFYRFIPHVHPIGRISMRELIYLEAIVCAAILTGIQVLAGTMIGELGESPYILTPKGILNNLLYVFPLLISREFIRSYILGSYCRKPNAKAFVLVTVIFTLCDVNFVNLSLVKNIEQLSIFIAEDFGPLLCQNILLSYLALYGGALAAISYLTVITIFHWTSPILPVLNWLTNGAIGILVPIFAIMFIIKKYENRVNNVRQAAVSRWAAIQWAATAIISIGLLWFVVGVFPIMPSVVATGSMEPLIYPGDIILMKKISTPDQIYSLKTGDVIHFQRGGIRITHRIIEIGEDESGIPVFHTKGDNNSVEDTQTVGANDIKGIYLEKIPKLGYPTLLLKTRITSQPNDVEF